MLYTVRDLSTGRAMWDVLFNFNELTGFGIDAIVYLAMALIGTVLFLLRLCLSLFAGLDSDADLQHPDLHAGDGFNLVSMLSITAFFMGTGWAGLAARIEWELGTIAGAAVALGFGFAMMMLASGLMFGARRLAQENKVDLRTAVGHRATAYVRIPAKGGGSGQVRVIVSGRQRIVKAVSAGPAIDAFGDVKVIDARGDDMLVVEPSSE